MQKSKFQFLIGFVCLAIVFNFPVAHAQSDEEDLRNALFQMTKNTELSCETLLVLDYPKVKDRAQLIATSKPVEAPVNLSDCNKKVKATIFDKALSPLFELLGSDTEINTSGEVSEDERNAQAQKVAAKYAKLQLNTKEQLDPFVDYCKKFEPKAQSDMMRVCYFGAPNKQTKGPARAAFLAMANNTLGDEALCAKDPLKNGRKIPAEFRAFLGSATTNFTWKDIRKSLSADGFACSNVNDSDSCQRWVLSIVLIELKEENGEQPAGIYGTAAVTPRQLTVYKGDWFITGPPGRSRCADHNVKKGEKCEPKRGVADGVCMVSEDWHTFYGTAAILNTPFEP
jgi:hypothetical protein